MKILHLPKYSAAGASSRHRSWKILGGITGLELDSRPLLDDEYLARLYARGGRSKGALLAAATTRTQGLWRRPSADVAIIEKELFPWCPWALERLVWPRHLPTVVDYDDAIYANYRGRRGLDGKIDSVMAAADVVVVGNQVLADRASGLAREILIIPTTVDTKLYRPDGPSADRFALGWIGTPMTQKLLHPLLPMLDELQSELGFQLVLVGARKEGPLAERNYVQFEPWSERAEKELANFFDLGLMPLPDDVFERGKCGFKLIQYGACALPVLASPVGANHQIVQDGQTGFLATDPQEWADVIRVLAASPARRLELGRAGRRRIEEIYDLEVARDQWRSLLGRLVKARDHA